MAARTGGLGVSIEFTMALAGSTLASNDRPPLFGVHNLASEVNEPAAAARECWVSWKPTITGLAIDELALDGNDPEDFCGTCRKK